MPRTVAAIGNFDGVHRGHQEIIGRVLDRARTMGAQSIAVTFDPHPLALLRPDQAPKLITPIPQRLQLLAKTGIDATLVIPFTREFSLQTAREFAERVLCGALHVVEVHEGDTFRFGHDASAGIGELRELGNELHFNVASHGSLKVRGITVSSSEVRRRIAAGQLGVARALLGRPFSILSTPVHGRGVGAKLTTPTINLAPYQELLPPDGVYVTRVRIGEGAKRTVAQGGDECRFAADVRRRGICGGVAPAGRAACGRADGVYAHRGVLPDAPARGAALPFSGCAEGADSPGCGAGAEVFSQRGAGTGSTQRQLTRRRRHPSQDVQTGQAGDGGAVDGACRAGDHRAGADRVDGSRVLAVRALVRRNRGR